MKKLVIVLAILAIAAPAFAVDPGDIVISQLYSSGGNTGATYNQKYVELFNRTNQTINISGWSLQYGSGTSTTNFGTCTNCLFEFPANTSIPPCSYVLVGLATGTNGVALPITPDFNSPMSPAGSTTNPRGKLGLLATNVGSGTACPPAGPTLIDLVGYGTTALPPNCQEGATFAPAPTSTLAIVRLQASVGGFADTDNNGADFVTGTPLPHNKFSNPNPDCVSQPVPNDLTSWGSLKSTYR